MRERAIGFRLQSKGYATLWASLARAQTSYELAQKHHLRDLTSKKLCQEFVVLGLAHVCDWAPGPSGTVTVPKYRRGPGRNASRLKKSGALSVVSYANYTVQPRSELIFFASAVKALKECAHDGLTLAQETGCAHGTALRLIRHLRALKLIYISEWTLRRRGGAGSPMYRIGSKKDAERPKAVPKAELYRMYDKERYQLRRATALNNAVCGVRAFTTARPCDAQPG